MTTATIDGSIARIHEQTLAWLRSRPGRRDFFGPLTRVLGKCGTPEQVAQAMQQLAATNEVSLEWNLDEGLVVSIPGHEEDPEAILDPSEVVPAVLDWYRRWNLHCSKRSPDELAMMAILKDESFAGSVRSRDLMPALVRSNWTRERTKAALMLLSERGAISIQTAKSGETFICLDGSLFQESQADRLEAFCLTETLWSVVAYPQASEDALRDGRIWSGLTERQAAFLSSSLSDRGWIVAAVDPERF